MKMITDIIKKKTRKKEKRKKEKKKKRKKEKWSVKNSINFYKKEKKNSSKLFIFTFSEEMKSRIQSKKESLSATINPGLSYYF